MKLLQSVLVGTISATTAPPMETTAPAISTAEYSLDAIRMWVFNIMGIISALTRFDDMHIIEILIKS